MLFPRNTTSSLLAFHFRSSNNYNRNQMEGGLLVSQGHFIGRIFKRRNARVGTRLIGFNIIQKEYMCIPFPSYGLEANKKR